MNCVLAALVAAALATTVPDPVYLVVGATVQVRVDAGYELINGGGVSAEDATIARVSAYMLARTRYTTVDVTGLQPGQTTMILTYASGISHYRVPLAQIVVSPCHRPSITVVANERVVASRQPVTLFALADGSDPLVVEWHDGNVAIGTANVLTITLSPGTHRIMAYASNPCGLAASEAIEVTVQPPRRRSVRP